MKTLQIIKEELAKEIGYPSLEDYLDELISVGSVYTKERIIKYINELSFRVQQEQQKIIAENAKVEIKTTRNDNPSVITKYENEDGFIKVNTESIINDKNIIR